MHLVTRECITTMHGTSCLFTNDTINFNIAVYVFMRIFEFVISDFVENKEYFKIDMPEILFT